MDGFIARIGFVSVFSLALMAETNGLASPLPVWSQAPGFYRLSIGNVEVTSLYDGYVDVDPGVLNGMDAEDVRAAMVSEHAPVTSDGIQVSINGFLINTGKNLILVDAGAGAAFGPGAGNLPRRIAEAGYAPADIDAILITHMHVDHFAGIIMPDGGAAFPNATVYLSKAEFDDSLHDGGENLPEVALKPYREKGRVKLFNPGQPILPYVSTLDEAGHTPGMVGYLVETGAEPLLLWGDLVHILSVQFPHPAVSIDFDTDQSAAIATRKKIMEMAAEKSFLIASPHLPFPGLGYVAPTQNGYRWIPAEYGPIRK